MIGDDDLGPLGIPLGQERKLLARFETALMIACPELRVESGFCPDGGEVWLDIYSHVARIAQLHMLYDPPADRIRYGLFVFRGTQEIEYLFDEISVGIERLREIAA